MNSRSYRSMSLILIEGKSLEQMVKRKVGEHLQKEVKMHSGKNNHSPQVVSSGRVSGWVNEEIYGISGVRPNILS